VSARRTAILFFTHTFDPVALRHLDKLRTEASGYGTLFVLNDGTTPIPERIRDLRHVFRFPELQAKYPKRLGTTLIPGNTHLAFIDFCEAHPEFEQIWVIEYDVWFSGSWALLFEDFRDVAADLIACHLRTREAEPAWHWWRTLSAPRNEAVPPALRAFLPIHRISRRALLHVRDRMLAGWSGHGEVLSPTLIAAAGMTLADLAGDRGYYTSTNLGSGGLLGLGTMRYRPAHLWYGLQRNKLYHPVKQRTPSRVLATLRETSRFWYSQVVEHRLRYVLEHVHDRLRSPR